MSARAFAGKRRITLILPTAWLMAAEWLARKSSSLRKLPRSAVIRRAIEMSLRELCERGGKAWPPSAKQFTRDAFAPLSRTAVRDERRAAVHAKIDAMFVEQESWPLADIRKNLSHRDRTEMHEYLQQLVKSGYVSLRQEKTKGRSRAVYSKLAKTETQKS